ncbi:hypothetical protein GBA63_08470 [Rubrobacter tropicus]|uniref:Uncharacterized protein n=1 Tax=Rubrobacter tropicus TaxID=2653851 RepID=A0A6G8Q862_9ACTN|nr:hypothetical protein [Rubrobacter tropicus]QIN82675.1 hypothetical protein GBA63_08470 [Rubrobacter tropicus]
MRGRSPQPPANGTVPLKLAVRLLRSHYPYADSDEEPGLFSGGLPDDTEFDVRIPDGFTLVGSADFAPRRGRRATEVVLDADMSASRVREVFRGQLSGDGWEEDNRITGHGGFARGPRGVLISLRRVLNRASRWAAVDVPGLSTVFRDARQQLLIISAEERSNAPTDVRLRLITGRRSSERRRRNDPEALFVMPLLTPPPRSRSFDEDDQTGLLAPPFDARSSGGEYGGSSQEHDGAYSFTALESDLDLPSLTAHYATQLEDAGWSRSEEGLDGPQAWSTWTFVDGENRPWEGLLTALHLPKTPCRYLLHLRADRSPTP